MDGSESEESSAHSEIESTDESLSKIKCQGIEEELNSTEEI